MNAVIKLLPCPFCNGEAEIERSGTRYQSMIIACTQCGCRLQSGEVLGETKPEHYQWNVRWNERQEKGSEG